MYQDLKSSQSHAVSLMISVVKVSKRFEIWSEEKFLLTKPQKTVMAMLTMMFLSAIMR